MYCIYTNKVLFSFVANVKRDRKSVRGSTFSLAKANKRHRLAGTKYSCATFRMTGQETANVNRCHWTWKRLVVRFRTHSNKQPYEQSCIYQELELNFIKGGVGVKWHISFSMRFTEKVKASLVRKKKAMAKANTHSRSKYTTVLAEWDREENKSRSLLVTSRRFVSIKVNCNSRCAAAMT